MALTPGLQLPFGIQPVNPVPVDSYSGPYEALTEAAAISLANAAIAGPLRFQSLEVRLIFGPTGSAVPYKYWYYGGTGDSDLIPFTSAATGASGPSAAIYQFGTTAGFPATGSTAALYISTSTNEGWYWNGSVYKALSQYESDITVSLSGGKTLGRYTTGQSIPAAGKTPKDVIELLAVEPINPTVSLTSATTIAFNQTAISNVLNLSYTINSLGASVASVSLEWRRNNTGSWTVLSTSTTTPTTYTHSLTDTNFNTQPFNYKYIVTDTTGATAEATLNITPASYVAPSISLTVAGVTLTSPETNTTREKGNVDTDLSGTVTRNSPLVDLTSYTLQFQVNGGAFSDIGSAVSIGPGTSSITLTNHNPIASNTATTIGYRVKVIDAYQTFLSSQVYSATTTVTFYNLIFYGPASSVPGTSSAVRALGSRIFTIGSNPFELNTGNTLVNFTAAMPASISITQVIDLDALNANITASYVNNIFNVDDAAANATSYNVYTMTIASPYSSNHRHQITRA